MAINADTDNSRKGGQTVILIQADSIDGTLANNNETVTGMKGLVEQSWTLEQDDVTNTITATLQGSYLSDQAKVLAESFLSSMPLINVATDLVVNQGIGSVWALDEHFSLDTNVKYFWLQQSSEEKTIAGSEVAFDAVNSHRLRLASRLSYSPDVWENYMLSLYVGAGVEHEFDGLARSTVDDYKVDAPSLEGTTGIGEIGFSLTPFDSDFSIDFGVQGYTGMREGLSVTTDIRFTF